MDEEESQEQSESQVYLGDLGLDIVQHGGYFFSDDFD